MTDTPQGSAAAMLARTKRTEIQHFADGGSVRRTTVRHFAKPSGAAAKMAQMPASHAAADSIEHGGPVRGPGGPTADKVPLWGSAGEFMLPADTTAAVGKEKLEALVDATHKPTNKAAEKMGRMARVDGGPIDDPAGAVIRVGNAYSGGNVSGPITINGQAPGGTVSTVDAFRAPPPPAPAPVLGAPAAVTPARAVLSGAPAAPAPTAVAPAPAPYDYANRNAGFNAAADARTAFSSQAFSTRRPAAAVPAPAAPSAPVVSPVKPVSPVPTVVGYADGGEIEDPRKQLPTFDSPAAAAQALDGMAANARSDMQGAAAVQLASLSPRAAAASSAPTPYVAEIPRGRYESAAPFADAAPAAAATAPVAAPAASPAAVAPAPAASAALSPPAPVLPAVQAPRAQVQLSTLPASAPARAPLGSLADTNAQLASIQASNAAVPQGGGAAIIDSAASEADRRAQFNEQANLGNALARTSWSPRRGTQANDAAVAAAMAPIDARARMAQVTAKEAGDTQRATIQERGADARAKLADTRAQQALGVDQQRLALEGKKITLDANRDDRAAAAAEPALALAQRKASLQSVVADPNSTPAQRQAAAQQIAGMEGKELLGHAPPAGYERTPDGNLKFIKGGPADPDTPKGKNNLTDTQAKALQFGSRMQEANGIFDSLAKEGKLFSTPGANNPITGPLVNQLNTPAAQQLDQAKRNFVNAVLRRESGAAISPTEFDSAEKQYFPQPGDDQKVIDQKRANRELSMRGILAEVPDAETRLAKIRTPAVESAAAAPNAAPAAGAAPVPPQVAELQRRAANNPALAQRLQQLGY
ncbi:hypothetical protein ABL850_15510 [Variovorax paradoxus]|uniref:hypothetical protein n=1 Tax=Variovorax paradoxus TaxID=34073 RepID=UPI00042887D0